MDSVAIGRHIDLDSIALSLRSLPPAARDPLTDGRTGRDVPTTAVARHSGPARTRTQPSTNGIKNKSAAAAAGASRSEANRCLTTSYCNRQQHWWKVCWIYNGSHLLDSARAKYSTLQRTRCIRKPDVPSEAFTTLPRDFRLSSKLATAENYLHNPKGEPKIDHHSTRPETAVCSGSSTADTCNKSTLPAHLLTESKSMTTLYAKQQSLFSFPSQIRLVDKITLPSKIAQPLVIWTKSRGECNKNDISDLLIQLKGANWRHQQLQYQMPIHDAELFRQPTAESRFIRNKQRKALVKSELFLAQHSNETCHKCKQFIQGNVASVKIALAEWVSGQGGKKYVSSSSLPANQSNPTTHHFFHIECYTCFECHEILVDLKAYLHLLPPSATAGDHNSRCEHNYNLFCCRHFVEIYKPRCPNCDHLILDEECTEAEGKAWHIGHFCCTECKRSLGGQQYIMASAEKKEANSTTCKQLPYCLTCFDILFGELCEECGELIGCEVGAIIHEGRSWHATDSCFRCSLCLKSLLGKPFLPALDGRIYCSLTCSQAMISHQKEKLRRQNKLHTLHSQKNSSLLSKPSQPAMDLSAVNGEKVHPGEKEAPQAAKTIKEHRDQFLKSMTLSRYEQKVKNSQKDYEKIKAMNLSQLVNYEQFIKQNNQFFTSKYDWSKEQEFVNTIDSNHELFSSQTTATLSDDHNSEDNSLAQQLLSKCELTSSDCSNSLERKSPPYFISPANLHHHHYSLPSNSSSHKASLDRLPSALFSSTQSTSSSQNSDIRFPLTENSIHFNSPHTNPVSAYYFAEKTCALNSPSSSNETAPSWAISPPPEYSKLDVDFKDENSSVSSSQNLPKDPSNLAAKSTGILKTNSKSLNGTLNRKHSAAVEESSCELSPALAPNSESGNFQPAGNANATAYFQSTPIDRSLMNGKMLNDFNDSYQRAPGISESAAKQSGAKQVSFDPNIEDKDESKRRYIRRIRSRYERPEHEDCSDSHSCSSCSTCSSSSSDDEDGFDFDLTNYDNSHPERAAAITSMRAENAGPGGGNGNNDACTIS